MNHRTDRPSFLARPETNCPSVRSIAMNATRSASSPATARAGRQLQRGRIWLVGWLTVAAALVGGKLLPTGDAPLPALASASSELPIDADLNAMPRSADRIERSFLNIEDLRVGDRVVADNPDVDTPEETAVDPATWRLLRLYAEQRWDDGTLDTIHVETLQPPEWIEHFGAEVGAEVPPPLDLIEMGLPENLMTKVVANEPCPTIEPGPGRVVLSTVNHLNPDVWELTVEDAAGGTERLRPTGLHKFYSDTRRDWVCTKEIHDNEVIRGRAGPLTLVSKRPLGKTERVYNLTVEGEHVYYVSSAALLTHNNCPEILFGQQSVLHRFRMYGPNPKLANRTLEEVANDLRLGRLTPDDIEIRVFRDPSSGALVTADNRGLAALTMAGFEPTKVTPLQNVDDYFLERLSEGPYDRYHPIPGRRIAVVERIPNKPDKHVYSVFKPER
jgi:hypothetical protein